MRRAIDNDCKEPGCPVHIVLSVEDDDDRLFQVIHTPEGDHKLQARDKEPKKWGKSKWG